MKVKTHPTSTNLAKAVTVTLGIREALALCNVLGDSRSGIGVNLYIALADALEADTLPEGFTISRACSELLPILEQANA